MHPSVQGMPAHPKQCARRKPLSHLSAILIPTISPNPQLLGRADEVSNYVRRGADKGWVKITLAGGPEGRETLIQRIMYSSKNSSDWSINGAGVVGGRETMWRQVLDSTVPPIHVF